jgi:triosephosphate isomerase
MKKLFIIANWKSNKNTLDSHNWLKEYHEDNNLKIMEMNIILSPSFTLLPNLKTWIINQQINLSLAAQDVSPFPQGAYTGEVSAGQIKEFAEYVIIGHSERRENFAENDDMLSKKVDISLKASLIPIYCVQDENNHIPKDVAIVAYEPPSAIGTGNPDTPESAEKVASILKKNNTSLKYVLYGGSVTEDNVKNFVQMPSIDGVLVGGASLDAVKFCNLIKKASS